MAAGPGCDPPIGIIAGSGGVPLELAAALEGRGRRVHIVALAGFAEPAVASHPHTWVGLGRLGRLLTVLRGEGCREIAILGGLSRPDLRRLSFDWGAVRHLPAILALTRGGDDSLLRVIVRFFEGQGFRVRGLRELAPELLAPAGPIAGPALSGRLQDALVRAEAALAELSGFDAGQAVVARSDGMVAIEAAEGTRRMLARMAAGGGAGGEAALVKLPKTGQELRVDLPTIGASTIVEADEAGVSCIAVAAGATVIAERSRMIGEAEARNVCVTGIEAPLAARPAAALEPVAAGGLSGPVEVRDVAQAAGLAWAAMRHARPEAADCGAIVRREHALAVEIDGLRRGAWPERLGALPRGWGLPQWRGRSGALALAIAGGGLDAAAADAIVALMGPLRRAGLAALAIEVAAASVPDGSGLFDRQTATITAAARRAGLSCRVTLSPHKAGRRP